MNELIKAIMQHEEQNTTEEGPVNSALKQQQHQQEQQVGKGSDIQQPSSRKRKLQFNGGNEDKKSPVKSSTKKRAGREKTKGKKRTIPNPEKENAPMNTVGSNGKKAKGSKKEKELAKKKAAEDTAISFFNGPGSSLLSLTNQNGSPNSSFTTLAPGVQGEAPPNSLSSFASPIPSAFGNKYPQFIPLETPPSKYDHQSMLDLLNSPLDSDDICFVSCQNSPEDTSPSSVGSLFKSSMGVLDHQQTDSTITCDDGSSKEDSASFSPADVTVKMVTQTKNAQCSNCSILSRRLKELETKLEMLSK